jgi:hypothetical protein
VLRLLTTGFSQCAVPSNLINRDITNLLKSLLVFTHFLIPPLLLWLFCGVLTFTYYFVQKCSCLKSAALEHIRSFLNDASSFICSHFLCRYFSLHLFVSLQFRSMWVALSPPRHNGQVPLSTPPLNPFNFQIPIQNHARPLLLSLLHCITYSSLHPPPFTKAFSRHT